MRVEGLCFRVQGSELRVQGSGCKCTSVLKRAYASSKASRPKFELNVPTKFRLVFGVGCLVGGAVSRKAHFKAHRLINSRLESNREEAEGVWCLAFGVWC